MTNKYYTRRYEACTPSTDPYEGEWDSRTSPYTEEYLEFQVFGEEGEYFRWLEPTQEHTIEGK